MQSLSKMAANYLFCKLDYQPEKLSPALIHVTVAGFQVLGGKIIVSFLRFAAF